MVNKIDAADDLALAQLRRALPDAVFVSARTGEGLERLQQRMAELIAPTDTIGRRDDPVRPRRSGQQGARRRPGGRHRAHRRRHQDQGARADSVGGQPARVRDVLNAQRLRFRAWRIWIRFAARKLGRASSRSTTRSSPTGRFPAKSAMSEPNSAPRTSSSVVRRSAPPLVLLHGAGATAVMWRPVIEALSATYRCYCVDTIIEGNKSVATRRSLGKTKLVAWLRQVFAALDIEQARVVGLSYGGWLAANLAVQAPELVNRLVLLCPAATFAPIVLRVLPGGVYRQPAAITRTGPALRPVDVEHTECRIRSGRGSDRDGRAVRQSRANRTDTADGSLRRHAATNQRADNGRDRGSRSHLPRRAARRDCQGAEADHRTFRRISWAAPTTCSPSMRRRNSPTSC